MCWFLNIFYLFVVLSLLILFFCNFLFQLFKVIERKLSRNCLCYIKILSDWYLLSTIKLFFNEFCTVNLLFVWIFDVKHLISLLCIYFLDFWGMQDLLWSKNTYNVFLFKIFFLVILNCWLFIIFYLFLNTVRFLISKYGIGLFFSLAGITYFDISEDVSIILSFNNWFYDKFLTNYIFYILEKFSLELSA